MFWKLFRILNPIMSKNVYLLILKTGIYLSLLSVFLVYNKFLFPYITSKQIYFNILIEVLFIFWAAFILKYPEYRPKKNWISIGLISFFALIFVTCFTGVDFNLSFWGDVERMLGFFHIFHFLVFYFIVITVMREWRDWKIFFILSIICACVVSYYGLVGRSFSTIGNTAYVSGYLIFNIYFALILFFKNIEQSNFKLSNHWLKNLAPSLIYLVPILIMLPAFKRANTSGAYVGFGISIFALLFLFGILTKNNKVKIYIFSGFLILALSISLLFINKNSDFVKSSSFGRVIKNISSEKNTFQTRLISWKAALYDFKNHPMLGTGYGNYAIIFDKYFKANLYNYTREGTYFDRAHNNLIGIVSTTGILGLISYLSIFVALAYYLVQGFRNEKIRIYEFVLVSSLVIAYFIQNLAVFDSLATYISLMMVLGFVCVMPNFGDKISDTKEKHEQWYKESYIFGIGLVMLFVIYQYNVNPIKMLKGTIAGQIAFAKGDALDGIEEYKKALSYNTGLDRDSRASLIRLILSKQNLLHALDKKEAKEILDYVIDLAEKNVSYNPKDSLMQTQLAQVLSMGVHFASTNNEIINYIERAHKAADISIKSSPERVRLYYTKAQIYLTIGDIDSAIKILNYAVSLNNDYYDSFCHLARIQVGFGNISEGYAAADSCIELGGARLLQASFVKKLITHYSATTSIESSTKKLVSLFERLSKLESSNAQVFINLAQIYTKAGEDEKAIKAAKKASDIDPSLRSAVDGFVKKLK